MLRFCFKTLLWLWPVLYLSIAAANPQPSISPEELEQQIHEKINRVRPKYGLAALDRDERLIAIARSHSHDMASHHFFNHINLRGESPSDRALRQGWDKQKQIGQETLVYGIAENIFQASLYGAVFTTKLDGRVLKKEYSWKNIHQLAETIVQGWMDSPPHRKILLSPRYGREGVGVFISGTVVYVTQNLF